MIKMDWTEELKMSIRKTTARKGRRSKSRDVLKNFTQPSTTASSTGDITGSNNAELSIDITLDMPSPHLNQQSTSKDNTSTPMSVSGDNSSMLNSSSDSKRIPALRRISGGWADSAVGNLLKSKKHSFEDDRFGMKSPPINSPIEDIPIIPDLDDIKEDMLLNDIPEPPSTYANRVVTLKELNTDLLAQNAFSAIEDVDLSILTKSLQPQETLDEADEVWEWEKLFTDVVAEINADKSLGNKMKNLELRADEMPKGNDD